MGVWEDRKWTCAAPRAMAGGGLVQHDIHLPARRHDAKGTVPRYFGVGLAAGSVATAGASALGSSTNMMPVVTAGVAAILTAATVHGLQAAVQSFWKNSHSGV